MTFKPKLYFEREMKRDSYEFLFISYSHLNKETVYEDLVDLYNLGVNFWYDRALTVGKHWNQKVKEIITDPKCRGTILYITKDYLKSDAIEEEIQFIESIMKIKDDFHIFPVFIGYNNMYDTIRNALVELQHLPITELEKIIPEQRIGLFLKIFPKQIIYLKYNPLDPNSHHNDLVITLKIHAPLTISSNTSILEQLVESQRVVKMGAKYIFEFGSYPQMESCNLNLSSGHDRICYGGEIYRKFQYKQFKYEPVKWIVAQVSANTMILFSEYVVDYIKAAELSNFFENIKDDMFAGLDHNSILECSILTNEEVTLYSDVIVENKNTNFALEKKNRAPLDLCFLHKNERLILMNRNLGMIETKIPSTYEAGIRIKLVVDINKLK